MRELFKVEFIHAFILSFRWWNLLFQSTARKDLESNTKVDTIKGAYRICDKLLHVFYYLQSL